MTTLSPGSNTAAAVPLEAGSGWQAVGGTVEVFLAPRGEDGTLGARWHVMRAQPGQVVFGMGPGEVVVLAVPAPGASLAAAESFGRQQLDTWIEQLGEAFTTRQPPAHASRLRAGEAASAEEQPAAMMPHEGVVWVRLVTGAAAIAGFAIAEQTWYPVTRAAWLDAQPGTILDTAATQAPDGEELLRAFHELALAALNRRRMTEEEQDRQRLDRKSAAVRASFQSALGELGAPLAGEDETIAPASADALVSACLVAAAAGAVNLTVPGEGLGGNSGETIRAVARASGVRARSVVLSGDWWRTDSVPLVGFREGSNEPVALVPTGRGSYRLHDPKAGGPLRVNRAVAGQLSARAWTFYRPFPDHKLSLGEVLAFGARGSGRDLVMVGVAGAATGLLGLAVPIATGVLFDGIIPSAGREHLGTLAGVLLVVAVAQALLSLASGAALIRMEGRMSAILESALWDRLLTLPATFFRDYSVGELGARAAALENMRTIITGSVLGGVLAGLVGTLQLIVMFSISPPLALTACAALAAAFVFFAVCGRIRVRAEREEKRLRGRVSSRMLQLLFGISKLRVAAAETAAFARWSRPFAEQKRHSLRARRASAVLAVFNGSFPILSMAMVFWFGARMMDAPGAARLAPGEFLAFTAAFQILTHGALEISTALLAAMEIVPEYERIRPMLEAVPEVTRNNADPGELSGAIELNHVTFRYAPGQTPVLRDVSLRIRAGEFVAIVGSSGSGKSTLFRILLGFEKPETGAVYYDNQDLKGLDVPAVRRRLGVVLQTGRLLSGDMMTNILGSAPLTIDDAWEAARLAGLDEDIRRMPMGMHTFLNETGGGLSGGQRQRLMIARAIVNRPRILLLDEATSALDNRTQAIVSESLERLRATRVVIAHRLSTVRNADRIIVLERGEIVETGNYRELMDRGGRFAELARRQLTGEERES